MNERLLISYTIFSTQEIPVMDLTSTILVIVLFIMLGLTVRYLIPQLTLGGGYTDNRHNREQIPRMDFHDLVETGNKLFQDYRYDDALVYYLYAVKKNTRDPLIHYRLGVIYEAMGDDWNAELAFRNVLSVKPDSIEALYHLAKVYQQAAKYEKALPVIDKLLDIKPNDVEAMRMKALCLLEMERNSDAITVFQQLLKQNPGDEDALINLAATFQKVERWNEALETYKQLLDKDLQDRRNLRPQVYQIYFIQGKYDEAIAVLEEIQATGYGGLTKEEVWKLLEKCYVNKAVVAIRSFQYDKAREFYEMALKYSPENPEIYKGLGKVQADQGNTDSAMQAYRQAQKLNPYDMQIFMNMGMLYEKLEEYDEAIRCFIEAGAQMPSPQIHYCLGTLYGQKGELDKCIEHLQKAVRMNAENADAHYNLGVAYEMQRSWRDARRAYKRVLTLDKDNLQAKCNLAYVNQKHL